MCAPQDKPRPPAGRPPTGTPRWLKREQGRPPAGGPLDGLWPNRPVGDRDEDNSGGWSAMALLPLVLLACRDRFDPGSPIGPMGHSGGASGYGGGLWPQCVEVITRVAARLGFGNGPFRLADHQPDCRYRRFVRAVTFGATP